MSTHTITNEHKSYWLKGNQLLLHYKIKEPKVTNNNKGNPLVLLLHGVGSNEEDLFRLRDQFPDDYYVISARAPFHLGNDSYAWYAVDFSTGKPVYNKEQAVKSRLLIVQFINQLTEKYNIDNNHINLFGFSQGAIMSYSVAISYLQKIKSIYALSGRILAEDQDILKQKTKLNVNVTIAHSKFDNILPFSGAIDAKNLLKDKATSVQFIEHNSGHSIPADLFKKLTVNL